MNLLLKRTDLPLTNLYRLDRLVVQGTGFILIAILVEYWRYSCLLFIGGLLCLLSQIHLNHSLVGFHSNDTGNSILSLLLKQYSILHIAS